MMTSIISKYKTLLVFLLYQIVGVLFFHQILLVDSIDRFYMKGDFCAIMGANYHFISNFPDMESLQWSPHAFFGFPFLAGLANGFYFPFTIILIVFTKLFNLDIVSFFYLYEFYGIGLLSTGGFFMYLFLSRSCLQIKDVCALCGGLFFMLSGTQFNNIYTPPVVASFIFYPLIFLYIEKYILEQKIQCLLIASLFHSFCILGANPEVTLYFGIFLVVFVIFNFIKIKSCEKILNLSLSIVFVFPVVSVLISCVQLLPSFEFTRVSNRGDFIPYASAKLEPSFTLLSMVLGNLSRITSQGNTWCLFTYYGVLVLTLFLLAFYLVCLNVKRWDNHSIYFWAFCSISTLFLYLGRYTILFDVIYNFIPFASNFRSPNLFSSVSCFSLSIVSALVIDRLYKLDVKESRLAGRYLIKLLGSFSVLFSVVSIVFTKKDAYAEAFDTLFFQFIIVLLTIFLLRLFVVKKKNTILVFIILVFTVDLNVTMKSLFYTEPQYEWSPEKLYNENEGVKTIQDLSKTYQPVRVSHGVHSFMVHSPYCFGIENYAGYESLIIGSSTNITNYINGRSDRAFLYGFFNVKYLYQFMDKSPFEWIKDCVLISVTKDNQRDFLKYSVGGGFVFPNIGDKFYILENEKVFPRFFLNYSLPESLDFSKVENINYCLERVENSLKENKRIPMYIEQQDVDEAILNYKNGILETKNDDAIINNTNSVEVVKYTNNNIDLKVKSNRDCMLVISNSYYPGWKSYVNNEECKLYKIYGGIQGLLIKKGEHNIKLYFQINNYYLYLLISFFSLTVVLLYIWLAPAKAKTSKVVLRKVS